MNAVVISAARPHIARNETAKPAVIQIDGEKWYSETPTDAGEAETFNADAVRIVEKLNR